MKASLIPTSHPSPLAQALLDDQIVKTQSMRASPYIKALESQAAAWEVLMVTLQEIVDNWLTCQVREWDDEGRGC